MAESTGFSPEWLTAGFKGLEVILSAIGGWSQAEIAQMTLDQQADIVAAQLGFDREKLAENSRQFEMDFKKQSRQFMQRLGLDKAELEIRKQQLAQQYGLDVERLGFEKERLASETALAGKRFGLERGRAELEKKRFGLEEKIEGRRAEESKADRSFRAGEALRGSSRERQKAGRGKAFSAALVTKPKAAGRPIQPTKTGVGVSALRGQQQQLGPLSGSV